MILFTGCCAITRANPFVSDVIGRKLGCKLTRLRVLICMVTGHLLELRVTACKAI